MNKRSEAGASMVEYTLLIVLLSIFCISAITWFGKGAHKAFSNIGVTVEETLPE